MCYLENLKICIHAPLEFWNLDDLVRISRTWLYKEPKVSLLTLSVTSKCQVSSERRLLDLESEVPGSILTEDNILLLNFFCFHIVKPLMSILELLPISSSLSNTLLTSRNEK